MEAQWVVPPLVLHRRGWNLEWLGRNASHALASSALILKLQAARRLSRELGSKLPLIRFLIIYNNNYNYGK
jgi:hypothetical protein